MSKILNRVTMMAAIIVATTSCGVYTSYERPEPSEAQSEQLAGDNIEMMADDLSVELPSWQELFNDIYLVEYINTALMNNSDIRIAALNITQAERGLSTARMAYLPSLSIGAEGSISSFDGSMAVKSYNVPLTASWEIDIFGKLRNAKEMSKAAVEQSEEYAQMVRTQLIAAVASNYYGLVLNARQIAITTESIEVMAKNVEVIKSLKEVGWQNQAAVEQSAANLREMMLTLKSLEQSFIQLENNLALLLNQTPHSFEHSDNFIIERSDDFTKSISLKSLSMRPDVRLAELDLRSNFYGVNYARSQLYPSITLTGVGGWTNIGSGVVLNPGAMLLSAIGSATQPLFMAGRNRANLRNAQDQYEQQLIAFEKSLLVSGNEVNDAITSIAITSEKLAISNEKVAMLSAATEMTQELMNSGKANYLEVLIAQNSYLASQLNHTTLDYTECIERISLFKALGGGRE